MVRLSESGKQQAVKIYLISSAFRNIEASFIFGGELFAHLTFLLYFH